MAANYYRHGDWNLICDSCGRKIKASDSRHRWDGLIVCQDDWEPRNVQDYVRGVADRQAVPYNRPEQADVFVAANEVTADDL